ncbi:glycoside hydrolase family 18 protein [Mycena galericulata]|nr:glycoside hydrolase family 18 protein [Mycena galericulata]
MTPEVVRRAATSRTVNTTGLDAVVAMGWYPDWGTSLTNVSWGMYSHVAFAFAQVIYILTTTSDSGTIEIDNATALTEFVSTARLNNVIPLLTIGGWTGSQWFSSAVATSENRTNFANAITSLVTTYSLDGIDFDWEFPGGGGLPCSTKSNNDSANFLSLLQEVRKQNNTLLLTSTASLVPFVGFDGSPMWNMSGFAEVLDWVELMVYDTWGVPQTAGPNAPLISSCEPVEYQSDSGSATSAVAAWIQASFPAHQIVLGLAAYGHSFNVTNAAAFNSNGSLNTYPAIGGSQPVGPSDVGPLTPDQCGDPGTVSGVFTFAQLVHSGFLEKNGFAAANIEYTVNECTKTPYVYDPDTDVFISYDDATSFAAKGAFISGQNLAGFAVWEATGDYDDILLSSLHTAIMPICE